MESESSIVKSCCPSGACGGGSSVGEKSKAYCKCGEGWSCVITKVEGTDTKPFYNCPDSSSCVCITEEGAVKVETEGAYCVCGEGYACTITKTDTGGTLVVCECGNGYTCLLNHAAKPTPAAA